MKSKTNKVITCLLCKDKCDSEGSKFFIINSYDENNICSSMHIALYCGYCGKLLKWLSRADYDIYSAIYPEYSNKLEWASEQLYAAL